MSVAFYPPELYIVILKTDPWVSSDLKALLSQKNRAFRVADREKIKQVQRVLKDTIMEA